MSEADARPSDAAGRPDRGADDWRGTWQAALALVVAAGAAVLAYVASPAAEPFVLTVMAVLATAGVFFLFALAAKHVRLGRAGVDAALLASIVDAVDDGVQVTDAVGCPVLYNRAFADLVGFDGLGELNPLEAALAPGLGGTEALFRLSRAAERLEHLTEEFQLTGGRGSKDSRWLRIAVRPFTAPGHDSSFVIWRVADVTAERAGQAKAIGAVESQLGVYAQLPLGLMTVARSGHVLSMNERLAGWLGQQGERARDLHLDDLVADGAAHLVTSLAADANVAAFGEGRRVEVDLIVESGRRWPVKLVVVPQGDRFVIGVLERGEDDRNAKPARSGEQRSSRLLQSAPFGVAVVDGDGTITSSNAAFSRLMLEGGAQRGANLLQVIARGDPEIRAQLTQALDAARDGKAQIPPFDIVVGAKGRELTRKVYVSSLVRNAVSAQGGTQEMAILYMHDVTEAKALEHRVAQAQKMEAVGTLAGGIAHDFNNVLTAIIGFSDLLLQTHKPGNPSYAHILSVKTSANRAAGLVRQLLAFSRRQTLQPKVLQLGDVLTDWSPLLSRLLGEKIELKITSGRDLWYVKADPAELERTIINLAVNARDAMLPKGGRLAIRTRNVSERDSAKLEGQGVRRGEYVAIEVEDNGTGMTPEVLAKIFDPFFTTKAVGKGTGLGLASVTGFVQQTGGHIIPESAPGVGTTFRIYLPRYHLEHDEEAEPVASAKKKARSGDLTGTGRVLLVEDEDAVRRFAVAALKSKGYEVLQAGNGVEAIEVLDGLEGGVDLVVSDVIMPEMDGPTLLKELRQTHPNLKFIFVSGYPDDAFKNNIDPDAEFTFLPKPYSLAQLAAKVKEQLGR